jgi:hypothetical protein
LRCKTMLSEKSAGRSRSLVLLQPSNNKIDKNIMLPILM